MSEKFYKSTEDWISLIPHITHDLRSPLVSSRLESAWLEENLPALFKGYHLAVENNLMEGTINKRHLSMKEAHGLHTGDSMTKVLGFLGVLDNASVDLGSDFSTIEPCSVQSYLNNLLANYPFEAEAERKNVLLKTEEDFDARWPAYFLEPMLFQLFEVLYDARKEGGEGEILLWTDSKNTQVHMRLTCQEFMNKNLPYFFERFAVEQGDGYAPGLGLCRLALREKEGDMLVFVEKEWDCPKKCVNSNK